MYRIVTLWRHYLYTCLLVRLTCLTCLWSYYRYLPQGVIFFVGQDQTWKFTRRSTITLRLPAMQRVGSSLSLAKASALSPCPMNWPIFPASSAPFKEEQPLTVSNRYTGWLFSYTRVLWKKPLNCIRENCFLLRKERIGWFTRQIGIILPVPASATPFWTAAPWPCTPSRALPCVVSFFSHLLISLSYSISQHNKGLLHKMMYSGPYFLIPLQMNWNPIK